MPTNRLYDSESIADNPYQLPVDAPQFDTQPREPVAREPLRFTIHPDNMTPGPPSSSTGEGDGAGYKLTPVDYDPWAESQTHKADTKREPLSDMQEMARKGATAVAGMPYALLKNLIVDPIKGAANLTNRTLGGEFVGNDMASDRSRSSDEYHNDAGDTGKALGAAALAGTGGLAGVGPGGVSLGSGIIRNSIQQPTQELLSRVMPAFRNLKTGEVNTTKRGNVHVDIAHKIWEKLNKDKEQPRGWFDDILDTHEHGYYDPKTKQFFSAAKDHEGWGNVDSTDLMTPLQRRQFELRSDTSEAGQVVQAIEKMIGNKKYTFTPVKHNPFGNDNLVPKNSAYENAVIDQWFENELKKNFGTSSKVLNAESKLKFTPVEGDPFEKK